MKTSKATRASGETRTRVKGFQVLENECIWMKAGVVNFHICDNNFDCSTCAFDKGLRRGMGLKDAADSKDLAPRWVAHLQNRFDGASRPCRHALTGRIDAPKICTLNYECHHCAFDQMLDDMDTAAEQRTPACRSAAGFLVADGYYYHMGHTWARFEHGGRVRIGFDDFLVRVFGAVQTLGLPPLGAKLSQNDVGWTLARSGHNAAVLSPVGGTVLCLNHGAGLHPEITHEDPYGNGWLMIVEPDAPKRNAKKLFYGDESLRWMEQESQKLLRLLGPGYEDLAATGGSVVGDIFGEFPEIGWDNLVQHFLHTARLPE